MEITIISPECLFYKGEATFVEFTSTVGEMGVYPNHIPLTTILKPCVMKVHQGDEVKRVTITGGFVEIQKDAITVMAEGADWA